MIGLALGALTGGGFEIAQQVNAKGWDLANWDWGKIINHTLVGETLGLAFAAGVVYLGPVIFGTATIVAGKTALIALGITTAISFAAGAGGYAIEAAMNNREISFGSAVGHGTIVAVESIWFFFYGGIVGSVGNVRTKGSFLSLEWIVKLIFAQEFTLPFKLSIDY